MIIYKILFGISMQGNRTLTGRVAKCNYITIATTIIAVAACFIVVGVVTFIITALRTEPEDVQEGANASNLKCYHHQYFYYRNRKKVSMHIARLENHKGD
jgi:hypothetical protein